MMLILEDALGRLGPLLIGEEWIEQLTRRERWLLDKRALERHSASIIPGHVVYTGLDGRPVPPYPRTEIGAAIARAEKRQSQRDQAEEWLEDRGLILELPDGSAVVDAEALADAMKADELDAVPQPSQAADQRLHEIATPGSKPGRASHKAEMCAAALEALAARPEVRGHGAISKVARTIAPTFPTYKLDTIIRYISAAVSANRKSG